MYLREVKEARRDHTRRSAPLSRAAKVSERDGWLRRHEGQARRDHSVAVGAVSAVRRSITSAPEFSILEILTPR